MVIAYLRVSTSKQHIKNQRSEIIRYAQAKGLSVDLWYNDIVSGKIDSHDRKLGNILNSMGPGDELIVTEISRLSRALIDIMNIINDCIQKNITLHCTKEGYIFKNNLNSKILGFAFGLIAEIERNLISKRTKEALAVRKASGQILGRPNGSSPQLNHLIKNSEQIKYQLSQHVTYKELAHQYKVSVCTLARFVKQHLKPKNAKL